MISILISILCAFAIHELGHITVALLLGVAVKKLGVSWCGPYIVRERSFAASSDVAISLAGPFANLFFACVPTGVPYWALANFVFFLFNMIPMRGSDCGHACNRIFYKARVAYRLRKLTGGFAR